MVSVGALSVAILHVAVPSLTIDSITLALIVIALLPWLGAVLESIELPGGLRLEYRELRGQVEHLAQRVDSVERVVFTGDIAPVLREQLSTELKGFADYLERAGARIAESIPAVRIDADNPLNAWVDLSRNEIVLGERLAADTDVLLREYSQHVLSTLTPRPWEETDDAGQVIQYGLADYLTCSYKDPGLGREAADQLTQVHPTVGSFVRNLDNARRFEEARSSVAPQDAGEVWGGAFWEMRTTVGQETADQLLLEAWSSADTFGSDRAVAPFVTHLLYVATQQAGTELAQQVRMIFERRGAQLEAPNPRGPGA